MEVEETILLSFHLRSFFTTTRNAKITRKRRRKETRDRMWMSVSMETPSSCERFRMYFFYPRIPSLKSMSLQISIPGHLSSLFSRILCRKGVVLFCRTLFDRWGTFFFPEFLCYMECQEIETGTIEMPFLSFFVSDRGVLLLQSINCNTILLSIFIVDESDSSSLLSPWLCWSRMCCLFSAVKQSPRQDAVSASRRSGCSSSRLNWVTKCNLGNAITQLQHLWYLSWQVDVSRTTIEWSLRRQFPVSAQLKSHLVSFLVIKS